MRIIAGILGGRAFDSPHGHRTHPMSDKIRGALFNVLGDMGGLTVLDAFAGSGALGFEAVSRGAVRVLAIDSDKEAYRTVKSNIAKLDMEDKITALRQSVGVWSKSNGDTQFDIVLADPPYDDIRPAILQRLPNHVTNGGVFVLSWPGGQSAPTFLGTELISQKTYGDAQLLFYRKV